MFRFLIVSCLLWSASSRADIIGGVDVTNLDSVRRSTAALFTPSGAGGGGSLCTASLIGKDTAVTAAHCIGPTGTKPVMLFGNNLHDANTVARPVVASTVNPKWATHQGVGMDQGDIAVVRFGGGVPDGYGTVDTMISDKALRKGEPTVLAGYGVSNAQTKAGAGVLRKTRVSIDSPRKGKSEMILDQTHGHGACHGDSGGPAFIRQGRKMVLAGVTNRSYPSRAADDCKHKVVYTKVSAYGSWIKGAQQKLDAQPQLKGRLAKSKSRPPKNKRLRLSSTSKSSEMRIAKSGLNHLHFHRSAVRSRFKSY